MDKLLHQRRGGCCLELNGLLALLLQALGYAVVRKVPCFVHAGRERGHANRRRAKFRTTASHFILLVQVVGVVGTNDSHATTERSSNDQETSDPNTTAHEQSWYLVDVGLGEPPMGPLEYFGPHSLNQVQTTVEGMQSRIRWDPQGPFVDGKGLQRTCLILEWKVPAHSTSQQQQHTVTKDTDQTVPTFRSEFVWEPRLQWDVSDAPLPVSSGSFSSVLAAATDPFGPPLQSFDYVIPLLLHPKSSFARQFIACSLTRYYKVSLSGRRILKITQRQQPQPTTTTTGVPTTKAPPKLRVPWHGPGSTESLVDPANGTMTIPLPRVDPEQEDEFLDQALSHYFGIVLGPDERLDCTASEACPANSWLWQHL